MELVNNKIYLTEEVKEIFGDVVETAYIEKQSYEDEDTFKNFFNVFKREMESQIGELIPDEWNPIRVELTNGKRFEIWSSERGGGISAIKKEGTQ
ncbi:hypothetical protein [Bacillus safensis]|uniref:hypothetical protein n=1 Tax=Bacillus safensis TaxID=561879 RepID=UPI00090A6DC3|nr:hypothetical protein [Bacillus safensis]APJ11071.1 hypothetical protein BSL056_08915 [Bacillus safensis]